MTPFSGVTATLHETLAENLTDALTAKRERLLDWFRAFSRCAVAFSGGVDSAVVAKAAQLAMGAGALAVTGISPSLSPSERHEAAELARLIGIRHLEMPTFEFGDPNYTRNAPDRCYYCKSELYSRLEVTLAASPEAYDVVVNGANLDDLGDYRPGAQAGREHAVRSPLVECGLRKSDVRDLAAAWSLPVWDKPAAPCLASRVAYGLEVTTERLVRVDRAERFLRERGFRVVRVRYHADDLARIEIPVEDLPRLVAMPLREQVAEYLATLGFKFVTLDVAGFRSGSLNTSLVTLTPPSAMGTPDS